MASPNITCTPLLIYDGDCSFCTRWVARAKRVTGEKVEYRPYQEVSGSFPEIPREEFAHAAQFIGTDGKRSSAAEAAFRTLAVHPWWRWPFVLYRFLPGFKWVSEKLYRYIADHRSRGACAIS